MHTTVWTGIIAKYTADCNLDTSFATGGIFSYPIIYGQLTDTCIVGNPIYAVHYYSAANQYDSYVKIRKIDYGTGILDPAFGVSGIKTLNYSLRFKRMWRVADGFVASADFNFNMYKFDNDFELVPSFGNNGISTGTTIIKGLKVLPDGKLVAIYSIWNGSTNYLSIRRYTPDWVIDANSSSSGIFNCAFGDFYTMYPKNLLIDNDGKYVVSGCINIMRIHMASGHF